MMDRLVSRLLFVRPQTQPIAETATSRTENTMNLSIALIGVRCILQYIVLPFMLPVLGIASNVAIPISLALTAVAIVAMISSLRRFWQINYRWKWHFLWLSGAALLFFVVFLVADVVHLLRG
jgi:hypothetical protein